MSRLGENFDRKVDSVLREEPKRVYCSAGGDGRAGWTVQVAWSFPT
jgi:hypothetical protein